MKGVLFLHLRAFVREAHPTLRWDDLLYQCGITQLLARGWDYPDANLFSIIEAASRRLKVRQAQFSYEFGKDSIRRFYEDHHWYFEQYPNARAFILALDDVHREAAGDTLGAGPPRFATRMTEDRSEVSVRYASPRQMVSYARGALEGLLDIYGERAEVRVAEQGDGWASFVVRFA